MSDDSNSVPPHEPTSIPGFHAYSHCVSVLPGGAVDVRVSGEGSFIGEVVRIGTGAIPRTPSEPAAAHPVVELGRFQARPQTVSRGSYVCVGRPATLAAPFAAELWCRPLADGAVAGLMHRRGFQLSLTAEGQLTFEVGRQAARQRLVGPILATSHWHHVVGQCTGESLQLFLDGQRAAECDTGESLLADDSPLQLGALTNVRGETACLLTGDICGPSLYGAALSEQEIARRYEQRITDPGPGCVGHWKFDGLGGPPFRDVSSSQTHGTGVNQPLRMVPGPRVTEEQPWAEYDPTGDPDFGHAVRLLPDQLIDCRWPETFGWDVPPDLAPGQYAIRLTHENEQVRFVPFIVHPAEPTAQLLCLSTTNTRIAYDYQPFDNPDLDYGAYLDHPSYPIKAHLMGPRRPSTGPGYFFTVINLELPFYHWLDRQGIAYNLYSEWDLEDDPSLWDRYSVVGWAGHCEYWTADRFENLQRFRRRGGHILSLSGNTCFWRVSLDTENGVMEVRKHGDAAAARHGGTVDPMLDNSHWHQLDYLPGTTMQAGGWPQYQLGLGPTNGWTRPCRIDGQNSGYEVLAADHELFQEPRRIRTDVPLATGGAGYETDICLSSMIERFGPSSRKNIASKDNHSDLSLDDCIADGPTVLARARLPNSRVFDYDLNCIDGELWAEMHVWQPHGEGITFAAGSCMAALALQDDENFSNFMLNVLDRMEIVPTDDGAG